jgi:hypothetical protein
MNCTWCQKRMAAFELVVYYLDKVPEGHVRGDAYVTVRICTSCLPVTKENDVFMGRTKSKPTNV